MGYSGGAARSRVGQSRGAVNDFAIAVSMLLHEDGWRGGGCLEELGHLLAVAERIRLVERFRV